MDIATAQFKFDTAVEILNLAINTGNYSQAEVEAFIKLAWDLRIELETAKAAN